MPTKVMIQAKIMARAPEPSAIFCGKLNTPLPIMEPTTSAASGNKDRLSVFGAVMTLPPVRMFLEAVVRVAEKISAFISREARKAPRRFFPVMASRYLLIK